VLLKIGIYGFLRFSLPMLPDASAAAAPWLFGLGVIGILYGALVALQQTDLKRLVAYSSVSHMGYIVMGLFALEPVAVAGANLQLVNHGLSAAGLFALVGMIYERYHTRSIANLGGIASRAPWLAVFFMLFTFSSIGLPGLNGFVGEFLILAGSFQRAWAGVSPALTPIYLAMAVSAVVGVVLGAWYMLWAVERVFFGGSREPPRPAGGHAALHDHGPDHGQGEAAAEQEPGDLRWFEVAALAPLAVLCLWIGLAPDTFLAPPSAALRAATAPARAAFDARMRALDAVAPAAAPAVAPAVAAPRTVTVRPAPAPAPVPPERLAGRPALPGADRP
jgi:NADH-quinone oxidoreductase subunit M